MLRVIAVCISLAAVEAAMGPTSFALRDYPNEHVVFSDDFNELNHRVWKHELSMGGGGNWEFQMYLNNRSISYVNNSIFYIQPRMTAEQIGEAGLQAGVNYDIWGSDPAGYCTGNAFYGCFRSSGGGGNILNPLQSARVRTAESFSFRYGRLEVRAKLPKGDWLWPAIWMLPRWHHYGEWPSSGEIDLMESRGNGASYQPSGGEDGGGVDSIWSTLHYGPYPAQNGWIKAHDWFNLPNGTDFSQDFHIFGLIWTNTSIYTYVDDPNDPDKNVLDLKFPPSMWSRGNWNNTYQNPWTSGAVNAPFDQEFYLIMNVAVGGVGGYWKDGYGNKPWSDKSMHAMDEFYRKRNQWYPTWKSGSANMQVDWVKVWQGPAYAGATYTNYVVPQTKQ